MSILQSIPELFLFIFKSCILSNIISDFFGYTQYFSQWWLDYICVSYLLLKCWIFIWFWNFSLLLLYFSGGTGLILNYGVMLFPFLFAMNVNNTNNNVIFYDPEDPAILLGEYDFEHDYFNLKTPNTQASNYKVHFFLIRIFFYF